MIIIIIKMEIIESSKIIFVKPIGLDPIICNSDVFISLFKDDNNYDENDGILIPQFANITNFSDISLNNFKQYLESLRYWNINPIPYSILYFVLQNKENEELKRIYFTVYQNEIFKKKVVKYFDEIDIILKSNPNKLCDSAVENNSLYLLKFLYDHKYPCKESICNFAAEKEMLIFLIIYINKDLDYL